MEYSNNRKKFKKEGFNIDVDDMSFGYKMCEIELIVDNEEEVKDAEDKIIEFVKRFGFENKKALTKRKAYFKMVKPEVYKELYGDN
jgi:adenylate cyclase class IV